LKAVGLAGAFGNPKPVQRPHPPIMIGGRTARTLRVVAEHADLWNVPGGDIDDCIHRGTLLDRYCVEIGRDPGSIPAQPHHATVRGSRLGWTGPRQPRRGRGADRSRPGGIRLTAEQTTHGCLMRLR
jgi:hypothetical protein